MGPEIRIIGKGCYFCKQLRKIVDELVVEMDLAEARVEQVDEMDELLEYGVVNPPALVVNGKLKMMGRVLVRSRIRQALEEEMQTAAPPVGEVDGKSTSGSAGGSARGAWEG
jgi:small redox-active disulfide protein 2